MAVKELPDKPYFKIGEVAELAGVRTSVLRFWETEFKLRPEKTRSNHRRYPRKLVVKILEIRELLYVKKFTIAGARQALKEVAGPGRVSSEALERLKKEVEELLRLVGP
jgi:DNA-binding transcriptional MerR regulator